MALAAVNFANGVVGAGIVGLPSAFNQMGLPLGVCSCVAVATCSQYTIRLLAEMGTTHGLSNYLDLSQRGFGDIGYYVCSMFQAIFAFGAMVTYLIIFADTLPSVLSNDSDAAANLATRRLALTISGFLVLLPLSLIRSFGNLARLGLLKLGATLFLTFTVCYYAVNLPTTSNYSPACKYTAVHRDYFPALGTIAFAFVCHHQTFLVQGSLVNATPRRFAMTTALAIFGSFSLSLAVACAGYLTFFENTGCSATQCTGDLFVSYEYYDLRFSIPVPQLLNTARLLLAANMIITYPGELMVVRGTVESILNRRRKALRWRELDSPLHDVATLAQLRAQEVEQASRAADLWSPGMPLTQPLLEHVLITFLLFLLSYTIAMLVSDISIILNLTGSTAAVFLSFLFPAALRLRLGKDANDQDPLLHPSNAAPIFVLIFGAVAFVASSGYTIVQVIAPQILSRAPETRQGIQCT
jgi:amino acid permease